MSTHSPLSISLLYVIIINISSPPTFILLSHSVICFIYLLFQEAAIASVDKYGVGSCGPRGFYGTIGKVSQAGTIGKVSLSRHHR